MKRTIYIIGVALLLLTASCGRQQQAKSIVKDFMEQNLTDASQLEYVSFSGIDSTRTISDSLLMALRKQAPQHFRSSIQYQQRHSPTLIHTRVRYLMGGDTMSATFYMDPQLTGVIAFKEN